MINTQKPVVWPHTCNEPSKNEIKKTIPSLIATKRIKQLRIHLTKEMQTLL